MEAEVIIHLAELLNLVVQAVVALVLNKFQALTAELILAAAVVAVIMAEEQVALEL